MNSDQDCCASIEGGPQMNPQSDQTARITHWITASDLKVGDVIKMYGEAPHTAWVPINRISANKSGGTLSFDGPRIGQMRRYDRICRATTKVERRFR